MSIYAHLFIIHSIYNSYNFNPFKSKLILIGSNSYPIEGVEDNIAFFNSLESSDSCALCSLLLATTFPGVELASSLSVATNEVMKLKPILPCPDVQHLWLRLN